MRDHFVFQKDLTVKNSKFYIELELDPEELQALGHITAQWAFLEYHIFEYTKIMCEAAKLDLPKEAHNDSFRKRMRTWDTVVRSIFAAGSTEQLAILEIIRRVGSLSGRRHKLVHGIIQWNPQNKETLNVYSRANPNETPWKIDVRTIEAFAREIATLNSDFLNVHNENPDFPMLEPGFFASPRRPGTPVPAEIPPEFALSPETIQAILKRQKQSSGEK